MALKENYRNKEVPWSGTQYVMYDANAFPDTFLVETQLQPGLRSAET